MTEQTIPSTPQEVAAAVLDAIEANPGSFNMRNWFWSADSRSLAPDQNVCGTTMCAAGWAAHVTGWTLLAKCCDEAGDCDHPGVMARRGDEVFPVEVVGAEALGLRWGDDFFYASENTALQCLREIAGR